MHEELTDLLRRHDPAAGKSLSQSDRRLLLRHALDAPPRRVPRKRLVTAMVAIVAITAITSVLRSGLRTTAQAPPVQSRPRPQFAQIATVARRQIQYATPGGTRIVWTLDPNFHM